MKFLNSNKIIFFVYALFNALPLYSQSNSSDNFLNQINPTLHNALIYPTLKTTFVNDFVVNDDLGSADQYQPAIANNGLDKYIIAWYDNRISGWNAYYQLLNSSGEPQGTNNIINNATQQVWHVVPAHIATSMSETGNFIVAWEDSRNGNWDIYFQQYYSQGIAHGTNIKVNDDSATSAQESPGIAMDADNNFILVWQDKRNGYSDIYFQRYNSSGLAQGTNTKVNDDVGISAQINPQIVADKNGNYIIVWEDYRNGNADIYFQRYNSTGAAQGVNTKVNDDAGIFEHAMPTIALDKNGNFIVVWHDNRNNNYNIYAQKYNSYGVPLDTNQRVNEQDYNSTNPKISISENGNYVITWSEIFNEQLDVFSQRYYSNGNKMGNNTLVVTNGPDYGEILPSVSINNNNIFLTWMDNRRQKGWDIYSKILSWSWGDVPYPAIPLAPSNLMAGAYRDLMIDLIWQDNNVDELGYKIERKTDKSGLWSEIATVPVNSARYSDYSVFDGTKYYYRIFAYNNGGNSSYSNEASATTQLKAPTELTGTSTSPGQIDISWKDNSSSETSYIVIRKINYQDPYEVIANLPANTLTYSDINLPNNQNFYFTYRVYAVNNFGTSNYSNDVTIHSLYSSPTNLIAHSISHTQINLTWSNNNISHSGFKIERKKDSLGVWNEITTVPANQKYYLDSPPDNGQYFYRVAAYGYAGTSAYSNESSAVIPISIPSTPTNLLTAAVSAGQINLIWQDNSSDEDGFKIERKFSSNNWSLLTTTSPNVTNYSNSLLTDGSKYFYRVYSFNYAGSSGYSNESNSITPLSHPVHLTATAISTTQINLNWLDESRGRSGYIIERKSNQSGSFIQIAAIALPLSSYNNTGLTENTTYYYRIKSFNSLVHSEYTNEASAKTFQITDVKKLNDFIPNNYFVSQNYPNPFNLETSIEFSLPFPSGVSAQVFDLTGRVIKNLLINRMLSVGKYKLFWNGTRADCSVVPSGIYFIKLTATSLGEKNILFSKTLKVVLMK